MTQPDSNASGNGGRVDPDLLAILVCPVDKAPLRQEPGALVCTECGRRYRVEDGIPNMLAEDAA